MKIMDLSGDDGECQIEAVVTPKTKKAKQARLPFQTLSTDSPTVNKKRKSVSSPDCRSAKQAKVNTKENAFKASEKKKTDDVAVDVDDKIVEETEENGSTTEKDATKSSKLEETADIDSPKNKKTPGKGPGKHKKSETKVATNSLTKFFKKIDSKESKNEAQSPTISKSKELKTQTSVDSESKEVSKNSDIEIIEDVEESKDVNESKQDETCDSDIELLNETSSSSKENETVDTSHLNETDNMDVDSDAMSDLDDSHDDNDDDSHKSDTDNKKTEHEDTDSKDDTSRDARKKHITPAKNKLLDKSKERKLTPKQLEKKLEIQKKREMRDKQRQEREKKLQEERESRKREKEEKQREREEKKREREEKEKMAKEQKRKEKELKEQKRLAELEQKQKEKEAKEEDRRKREEAKEEEKRRKEEEKLEAERKKQKAASNFVSFFVPKKPAETKPVEEEKKVENRNFMPFEVKADMRLAPAVRRQMSESEKSKFDDLFVKNDVKKSNLYISELKNKKFKIRKSGSTWPPENNDDIVILEDGDDESVNVVQATKAEKHRAKLFLFHENRRPPYWGTWRKKSKSINPRRPFAKDEICFDYEVDSDDEWEEEEPGESLRGSDDEKDKDEEDPDENDYDVDNEFMVPHGYLSDEEIMADEEDDEDDLNPENQKNKLKILGEQFEAERKTKTTKLKPKVIGCVWLHSDNSYPASVPSHTSSFLTARQAWTRQIPVVLTAPADADKANDECGTPSSKAAFISSARKAKALEEAMPDLIRLVHGNINGCAFLVKELSEFLVKTKEGEKPIPKLKIQQKIKEVAAWMSCPESGPMHGKYCWWVTEETRKKYFDEEKLPMPNAWTYCLEPKRRPIVVEATEKADEKDKEKEKEKEKEKKTVPLITQFTKTMTSEEMQKQLTEKSTITTPKTVEKAVACTPTSALKPTPPSNRPPKRATLISVPRGEPLPKSPRVSLMDKFVTKDGTGSTHNNKKPKSDGDDDEDCMVIDNSDESADVMPTSTESESTKKDKDSSIKEKSEGDQNVTAESEEKSAKPDKASANSDVEIVEI